MIIEWIRGASIVLACAGLFGGAAPACAQTQASAQTVAPSLTISGEVRTPLSITPEQLKAMPRTSVEVKDENGQAVKYEGVLVGELLAKAGATTGQDLRGGALTTYVLASASDGYQVLFSLAELDSAFTTSGIIVADTVDGKPLFAYQGPFRIVAPKDARPARSIRMLQRLEVVRLKK